MKNKKKIAIVGAGFFGCTLSLILSKRFNVDLYERKPNILNEASMCNQLRFHEGFHYPRSLKTINEIKKSNSQFVKFYGNDIFGTTKNFYAISKKKSKINFENYIKFLKKHKLNFRIKKNIKLISDKIEGVIETNEKNLNYFKFKKKILLKLKKSNVNLKLSSQLDKNILRYKNYDHIVVAAYKNNNNILNNLGFKVSDKYRYELVEKIAVKLPKKYKNISFVVLDGDFVCIDPYIGTKLHLISHVKYSKIKIINSYYPKFASKYDKFLIKTKNTNIKKSKFNLFIKYGLKYLPYISKAKYKFSYFVVRTIKYKVEKTSERVNLVKNFNNNVTTIMSGKWNTCVTESFKIEKYLLNKFK